MSVKKFVKLFEYKERAYINSVISNELLSTSLISGFIRYPVYQHTHISRTSPSHEIGE